MAIRRHILASAVLVGMLTLVVAIGLLLTRTSPVRAAAPGPVLPDMMDEKTIKAIDRGVGYLAQTQRNNGAWLNSGGYGVYPSVMTSLAGLALLANGSTPESGPYSKEVTRAMNYILNVAEAQDDGMIAGPGAESRSMYGHGFAMLLLAECYGIEMNTDTEKRIKKALDKAVTLTANAQSDLGVNYKHAGGWIYTPDGHSDEGSVTVTQLQALRACRNAGINVPKTTIERAVLYLKACQQSDGGICYSFASKGSSRPAISAAAIACFYAAGVYDRESGGKGVEAEMVDKLLAYVKKTAYPDQNDGHWYYTQYYMAQGMYQHGGKDWTDYYPKIRNKLLSMQNPDGSWNGDDVGTTFGTSMALVILQLPYGYLPIYQR